MSKELKYPSKETITRLTKELQLKGADDFTQDWECEVANAEQLQNGQCGVLRQLLVYL